MGLIKIPKSDCWYLDYRVHGKRIRQSSGTENKKLAQKMLDELRFRARSEQLGIAAPIDMLFRDFFLVYLERKAHKITQANDRMSGNKHLIPFFGGMKLSQIRSTEIEAFKWVMAKKGSKTTANRMLALLRHCLNLAVEWEMLSRSPFKAKLFKEYGRERVLSHEEEAALLSNCEGNLWLFVKLAFCTGARAGELKRLTWGDVDFEHRAITFRRTKNGSTRVVSMNSEALDVLQLEHTWNTGSSVIGLTTVSKAFRAACKKAGLETTGEKKVTPHTIRHSVATRLSWAGVDLPTIGAILGHSQPSTIFKYAHPGSQVAAVEKLTGGAK